MIRRANHCSVAVTLGNELIPHRTIGRDEKSSHASVRTVFR